MDDGHLQASSGAQSMNDEFSLDQNMGDDGIHSLRSSNAPAEDDDLEHATEVLPEDNDASGFD